MRNTSGLKRGFDRTGIKNRATTDVKTFFGELFDDPEYRASLRRRILRGDAPHMETLGLHHTIGKPKDTLDLNLAELAPLRIVIEDARGD